MIYWKLSFIFNTFLIFYGIIIITFVFDSKIDWSKECKFDLSDISKIRKSWQVLNALSPIVETLDGIITLVILVNENAYSPIVCKFEFVENSTLESFSHAENALSYIAETLGGI